MMKYKVNHRKIEIEFEDEDSFESKDFAQSQMVNTWEIIKLNNLKMELLKDD